MQDLNCVSEALTFTAMLPRMLNPPPGRPHAKAAMLALLQRSVCAIEMIGIRLFEASSSFDPLRSARDNLLASTAAGREWIALFESAQFVLLSAVTRDAKLMTTVGDLLQQIARSVGDADAMCAETDQLGSCVSSRAPPTFQNDGSVLKHWAASGLKSC